MDSIAKAGDKISILAYSTGMKTLILVFLGGGAGSVLRYVIGTQANRFFGAQFPNALLPNAQWPWGTFVVNLLGCFIMGLCFRLLPLPEAGPADARLLLMTGVLGGFTTFSAFALDSAQLWMRQDLQGLMLYLAGSFVCTLSGVALGLAIGKALSP